MTKISDEDYPIRVVPRRRFARLLLVSLGFALLLVVGVLGLRGLWPVLPAALLPGSLQGSLPASPAEVQGSTGQSPAAATPIPPSLTPSPTLPVASSTAALETAAPELLPTLPAQPAVDWGSAFQDGLAIVSADENGFARLFACLPGKIPLVRLTAGDWDDITPALSPDGTKLAFASNREGVWDLYVMELSTGEVTRLTQSAEYDGHPSWSPDGLWLAYESYVPDPAGEHNLEVFIRPLDGSQDPIQLTADPGADYDPAWSPAGRQVAFVSTRSGEPDIWLADLDQVDERFTDLSRDQVSVDSAPAWSPDGSSLVWSAAAADGLQTLLVWQPGHPDAAPRRLGAGSLAAWSPDSQVLLAVLSLPNQTYLTGYSPQDGSLALPLVALSGAAHGLAWGAGKLAADLPAPIAEASSLSPAPLWLPAKTSGEDLPAGRARIVTLPGINAPYPSLQDGVDESFYALKDHLAQAIGWDFLATLEQAYQPLTSPLYPGMVEDWLYTGRGIRFNTAPINAGWLVLVREDFGPQTYWRIYLRARFQDGAQGMPLKAQAWDLGARFKGDPLAYERGGARVVEPPQGYWIDFTRLAAAYGWERMPALSSWRSAYTAARYNEFVLRDGRDWMSAMLEVYPRQALDTPTPVSSPTLTPTPTKTMTPSITPSPTRRPTITPTPTFTRRPTITLTPTFTRRPSATPTPAPAGAANFPGGN